MYKKGKAINIYGIAEALRRGGEQADRKVCICNFLFCLLHTSYLFTRIATRHLGNPPVHSKTYWPAGGARGQNPENTAQGHSGHNAIRP